MAIRSWLVRNQSTVDTARSREMPARRISYTGAPTPKGAGQRMVLALITAHLEKHPGQTITEISEALGWQRGTTDKYISRLKFPFTSGTSKSGKGVEYRYYRHGEKPS